MVHPYRPEPLVEEPMVLYRHGLYMQAIRAAERMLVRLKGTYLQRHPHTCSTCSRRAYVIELGPTREPICFPCAHYAVPDMY